MEKIKKTVLFTSYECNNNCIFCIDTDKRKIRGKTTSQIKREIIGARSRGSEYLEFIGGETSLRSDFILLIEYAKELGFKTISTATNGRMYSYLGYVKKAINAGLTHVIFSIHGHNRKLHDYLTQADGSFDQLKKGIENFKKLGFDSFGSNTTVVKQNYKSIENIGKFICGLGIKNSEFIFVDPNYGAANKNFNNLVPRISVVAPYIHKCLDIGKNIKAEHWHVRYIPLCYFKDYLDQVSELEEVSKFQTEHLAPDFENYNVETTRAIVGRKKTDRCKGCKLFNICEGIWLKYLEVFGDKELKPIKNL